MKQVLTALLFLFLLFAAMTSFARYELTTDKTVYCRLDGDDANDGSADDAQHAWRHPFYAMEVVQTWDVVDHTLTIKLADGIWEDTYIQAIGGNLGVRWDGVLVVEGNAQNPGAVVIRQDYGTSPLGATTGARIRFRNLQVESTGTCPYGVAVFSGAYCELENVWFGSCVQAHVAVQGPAVVVLNGQNKIVGGSGCHFIVENGGYIKDYSQTTLEGTPVFTNAFAYARSLGSMDIQGTFTGSAIGIRFASVLNSVIHTGGRGNDYLPGNSAGWTYAGGQYY